MTGLISALSDPTDPTDTAAWDDVLDLYDLAVDGKYALDDSSVRVLTNPETWRFCRKLQVATSGRLLRDLLPDGRFRMSANMPDTASGIATVLTHLSGPGRGFTQAIWRGIRLIRDPYTKSAEDQIALTTTIYVGQDMVDSARYARRETQTDDIMARIVNETQYRAASDGGLGTLVGPLVLYGENRSEHRTRTGADA